ncbi:hypothetical protein GIB67_032514 [Kingdonia uniflora]|uniref:Uncharacterized protein n=1 Tax=Kingdonia uniflora TaxID=39325 RepID=A0A7J7L7T5_9MAGN|nr:hypothetical protein GIB67_032514 [Kingdonia uniflora]
MDQDQTLLCITTAFLYLQRSPVKRPSIKEVIGMLSGDSESPHLPVEFSPSPPSNLFKSQKKARGWSSSSTSSASAVSSVSSSIYFELWHACAVPLTSLPKKGSVVYFPQGHIEQAVSSSSMPCLEMPIFGLQPQIFCRVVNVQLLANKKNDEVYTQVTLFLEPENNAAKLLEIALDDEMDKEPNVPLPCLEVSLLELLPVVPVEPGGVELDSHSSCNLQGCSWYQHFLIEPMCQRMGARLVWAMSNFIVFACLAGIAIISLFSVSEYSEGIQHVLGEVSQSELLPWLYLRFLAFLFFSEIGLLCNTIFPNIDNYKPEDLSRRSIADGLQASNTDLEHKPEEDSRRYHKHFRWNNGSKHSSRSRPIKGHCNFIVLKVTIAVQRSNFIQLHSSRTSDLEDI